MRWGAAPRPRGGPDPILRDVRRRVTFSRNVTLSLARLREVTASQGLMLESMRDDLVAHQASPTKDPALRLRTISDAGALRIPFTSGILVGIGESEDDRVAALEALAAVHGEHGHLQ